MRNRVWIWLCFIMAVTATIRAQSPGDTTATGCVSFTWYGQTYNESGDYTHLFPGGGQDGNDSTVILHLSIIQPPEVSISSAPDNDTICAGESITLTAVSDCFGSTILEEDFSCLLDVCDTCGEAFAKPIRRISHPIPNSYKRLSCR